MDTNVENGKDGKDGEDDDVEGKDVKEDHIDLEEEDVGEGGEGEVTNRIIEGGAICLLFSIFSSLNKAQVRLRAVSSQIRCCCHEKSW